VPDSTVPSHSPVAIIWIPGLGSQEVDENLVEIAKRIAFACDRTDVREATFAVRTAIEPEQIGGGAAVLRSTVLRTDPAGTRPVLDVFGLPTNKVLIGNRAGRSLLSQLSFAGRALARLTPKAWRTWRKDGLGKTRAERYQLLYARVWLLAMMFAFVAILAGLASTLAADELPKLLHGAVAIAAGFGGWGIWKSSFAKRVGQSALIGYSVVDYLDRGEDDCAALRGQLAALVDYFGELGDDGPKHVDVLAYSFGSIVALDALFPFVGKPPHHLTAINRLITIGCPFDFIRTYWPDYFTKRFSVEHAPRGWFNFYAPSDVLASNFREDSENAEAAAGIEVRPGNVAPPQPVNRPYYIDGRDEPVSGLDSLLLKGLRFHAAYWSSRVASEESVFDEVIPLLGAAGS
jgi:hypothetical protein